MDNKLDELAHVLGGVKGWPPPRCLCLYLILQRTVYLFCTLLPFALVGDLHYMTPFVSVFISYTFCRGIRWRKSWKIRSAPQPTICR
jgi:putative membrane protein